VAARAGLAALLLGLAVATQPPGTPAAPPAFMRLQTSSAPLQPGASKNFAPLVNHESQSWTEQYLDVPIVGQVTAYVPKAPTTHVALFLSGDDGWQLGVVDMARRIASKRVIVVGLNFVWMRRNQADVTCWDTSVTLETIARAAETALGLPAYHPPTLVGYSSGATMVYAALRQDATGAFAAGMSLGFCPDLPSARPACPVGDWQPTFDEVKHTAWLPTTPDIKRDWYVLHGLQDTECTPAETERFVSAMAHAHYVPIEGTGHGFGRPERWGPPFDEAVNALFSGR
jgi:type IV secretory pathway VirJ component